MNRATYNFPSIPFLSFPSFPVPSLPSFFQITRTMKEKVAALKKQSNMETNM